MTSLTTHVLDVSSGKPASNVEIRLFQIIGGQFKSCGSFRTNSDGRTDTALLVGEDFNVGEYQLEFDIQAYYKNTRPDLIEPHFLNTVIIRFSVSDSRTHYHVPLVCSPWSYSTYRGS